MGCHGMPWDGTKYSTTAPATCRSGHNATSIQWFAWTCIDYGFIWIHGWKNHRWMASWRTPAQKHFLNFRFFFSSFLRPCHHVRFLHLI
jgi:hypothetical protein